MTDINVREPVVVSIGNRQSEERARIKAECLRLAIEILEGRKR
jgi:hypothetical protein